MSGAGGRPGPGACAVPAARSTSRRCASRAEAAARIAPNFRRCFPGVALSVRWLALSVALTTVLGIDFPTRRRIQ
ncbi:hypothetical protein chiPu_0013142 [Chiloscyllium punctatum]|uniref:Uncharacterized protein n=1 Tax=Chiloscyllium punctatum TaxID=137246 RepID=A0A401SW90_CHIPU|nr:hypothetical protein [Chiloscyllium punctatum]